MKVYNCRSILQKVHDKSTTNPIYDAAYHTSTKGRAIQWSKKVRKMPSFILWSQNIDYIYL